MANYPSSSSALKKRPTPAGQILGAVVLKDEPENTTRTALIFTAVVAAIAVIATLLALPRAMSLWGAEAKLDELRASADATPDDWMAAADDYPNHRDLQFQTAALLEDIAIARPGTAMSIEMYRRAVTYYERAIEADPFNGLALLRRAHALLASTPRNQRDALREEVQGLVERAFATSPNDPYVAEEGFRLLLRDLSDAAAAQHLARQKLKDDRSFIETVAEVSSTVRVPVATIVDAYIPPMLLVEMPRRNTGRAASGGGGRTAPDLLSGNDPTGGERLTDETPIGELAPVVGAERATPGGEERPEPILSELARYYARHLLVSELEQLVELTLERPDLLWQLEPAAPEIVDILASDESSYPLAKRFWLAMQVDADMSWPDENLIYSGDVDRHMVTGGFSWTIETTGAFFYDWRRPPPIGDEFDQMDAQGLPVANEALALGRHPNQLRGSARLTQRMPTITPGRYLLTFYQRASSRTLNDALRVRLAGVGADGRGTSEEAWPRLTTGWERIEIEWFLDTTITNARLQISVEARNVEPSPNLEFIELDHFRLRRVGDLPTPPSEDGDAAGNGATATATP